MSSGPGSLGQSPLFEGTIYGLHVGRGRTSADGVTPVTFSSNWGQGAETGKGRWTQVDLTLPNVVQNGDINLATTPSASKRHVRNRKCCMRSSSDNGTRGGAARTWCSIGINMPQRQHHIWV